MSDRRAFVLVGVAILVIWAVMVPLLF